MTYKDKPSLTVVLPAHNAEKTIAAAIQSILWQTYTNFELWVLENGSTDNTLTKARSFMFDPRIKVFELGSIGFQGALEFALQNVKTPWIARMDADDISFPQRLEKQMSFLAENPNYLFVGTTFVIMTPYNHIFGRRIPALSMPINAESLVVSGDKGWSYADASVIFNREAALNVGGYDSEFKMGDQPLWFRLLERGQGYQLGEPLYIYRSTPISMNFGIYHNEIIKVRQKYLKKDFKEIPFDMDERNNKFWYKVACQELIAGNGYNVRNATKFLNGESTKSRKIKLFCLSYFAALASFFYQVTGRSKYVHLPDLEHELFHCLVDN